MPVVSKFSLQKGLFVDKADQKYFKNPVSSLLHFLQVILEDCQYLGGISRIILLESTKCPVKVRCRSDKVIEDLVH